MFFALLMKTDNFNRELSEKQFHMRNEKSRNIYFRNAS